MKKMLLMLFAVIPWIVQSQEFKVIDQQEVKALQIPDAYINLNGKALIKSDYYNQLKSNTAVKIDGFDKFDELDQIDGWPLENILGTTTRAGRSYDLDGDGVDELIFGAGNTINVYNINGDLMPGWPNILDRSIGGAPVIGNIDDDPEPEIIVTTNFSGINGSIYAYDIDGSLKPGFPISYEGAPQNEALLENIDGDPEYEILVAVRVWPYAYIYAYNGDGSLDPYWENVQLDFIPGCSLSSGDINGDGVPEIIASSYWTLFVFDIKANNIEGFPFTYEQDVRSVSYSNPVLADIDEDGLNEIIIGTCNEQPTDDAGAVYILNGDGSFVDGWPQYVYRWIFAPISVADLDQDGHLDIIVGDQVLADPPDDFVHAWNANGEYLPGFPIGGLPAINAQTSIGDLDGDSDLEIICDNNMYMQPFQLFNHDGTVFNGFELDPGFASFYNSAILKDINGDGNLNIMVGTSDFNLLESTQNIYDVTIPFYEDMTPLGTQQYNSRNTGEYGVKDIIIGTDEELQEDENTFVFPNPFNEYIYIDGLKMEGVAHFTLYNTLGEQVFEYEVNINEHTRVDLNKELPAGVYLFKIVKDNGLIASGKVTH